MIISSKGRYALRVMLELAQYGGDGAYIRLGDIAQRQGISRKYLESIMTALAKAGLVESALGKAGGYRLVRPAEDYPINAYVNSYTLRDLLNPRGQENNESRGSSACGGKEDKVL